MIGNLRGGKTYNITVRMVNEIGPGPVSQVNITTPPEPIVSNKDTGAVLIVANNTAVSITGLDVTANNFHIIYVSAKPIVGIAIHVAQQLLFVADEAANVFRMRLDPADRQPLLIRRRDSTDNGAPLQLSMDWLNDQLYMLIERRLDGQQVWHIARCHLNGDGETVVLAGLRHPPTQFEVDPYNGYLFWTVAGSDHGDGLFRMDLADASNGPQNAVKPFAMLAGNERIGPFTIDYVHFRLLVPLLDAGRVIELDLSGKHKDVRNKSNMPSHRNLTLTRSIVSVGDLFYWTDGEVIWIEEFHVINSYYYQNSYQDEITPTLQFIRVNGSAAQPVPRPVNAPSAVQAVLDMRRGKLTWHVPRRLPMQGRGAWQTWNYLLEVHEENGLDTWNTTITKQVETNASGIQHEFNDLKPDTSYRFKAVAFTSAGAGPWSAEFVARTLRLQASNAARMLLWSSSTYGLFQTDMLGDVQQTDETLRLNRAVRPFPNVTRMAWHADSVYLVSNGTLAVLNRTAGRADVVEWLRGAAVQSVSVDWIGERLFWLNTDEWVIYHSPLAQPNPERLVSVSRGGIDMQVDALGGWLYYASDSTVSACRLNGRHRYEYYKVIDYYRDMHVQALALAPDVGRVFWIGRDFDRASLFSAPMRLLTGEPVDSKPLKHPLHSKQFSGPLTYVSGRLIWLQDEHTAVVANLSGANVALMRNESMVGLRTVLAVDEAQQRLPAGGVNVHPEAVDRRSIRVLAGDSPQAFRVAWHPVQTVTYGQVFYEVRLLNVVELELSNGTEVLLRNIPLPPYTEFEMSVQAYTWWARGPLVRATLRTPSARPDPPQRVRIFVQPEAGQLFDRQMVACIRWSEPLAANGPLLGWALFVWHADRSTGVRIDVLRNHTVPLERLEYVLAPLLPDTVYHVQVQVRSDAGYSPLSVEQTFNSSHQSRVPQLFVSGPGQIYHVDLDRSTAVGFSEPRSRTAVPAFTQIVAEQRSFWADANDIIEFDGLEQKLLYSGQTAVQSVCVDWVNRALFWSQPDGGSPARSSTIYQLDLNNPLALARPVEARNGTVRQLAIDPSRQWLLWLESNPTKQFDNIIYKRQLSLNQTAEVFRVTGPIEIQELTLFEILGAHDNDTTINYTQERERIPTNRRRGQVAADGNRLYWLDANSTIHSNDDLRLRLPHASHLFAIRPQRYPDASCLVPLQPAGGYTSSKLTETASSLQLLLPAAQRPTECSEPIAGTAYTIRFGRLQHDEDPVRPLSCTDLTCTTLIAYDRQPTISQLQSYSAYKVQIAVSHYFARRLAGATASAPFGPPVVFRTDIGAPSAPRQLNVTTLSPTELRLTWLPVEQKNAKHVWYEVLLNTLLKSTSQMVNISEAAITDAPISFDLDGLQPGQSYRIAVRASSGVNTSNQTDMVDVRMLPQPAAVQLLEATAYTLHVNWSRYPIEDGVRVVLQCSEAISEPGQEPHTLYDSAMATTNDSSVVTTGAEFHVDNLQPMTRYRFTVLLYMQPVYATTPYRWPSASVGAGDAGRNVFVTQGDVPSAPGKPTIVLNSETVYTIRWEPAREHGSAILEYRLEAWMRPSGSANDSNSRVKRLAHDDDGEAEAYGTADDRGLPERPASAAVDPAQLDDLNYTRMVHAEPRLVDGPPPPPAAEEEWRIVYNGTDNYSVIKDGQLSDMRTTFRVVARNSVGWGPYSVESVPVGEHVNAGDRNTMVLAVAVSLSVVLALSVCAILGKCKRLGLSAL